MAVVILVPVVPSYAKANREKGQKIVGNVARFSGGCRIAEWLGVEIMAQLYRIGLP